MSPYQPKSNEMVVSAISSLKRKGTSRVAILKYISANYKFDYNENKINMYLKRCLRSGISTGLLIKALPGIGINGSFKVAVLPKVVKKIVNKPVNPKKTKKNKNAVNKISISQLL